jgi:LysM repeat protein
MKFQTLPVKRNPVPKGLFRRLHAVTQPRRQRVAAAAAPAPAEMDLDDGSSKVSRALFIIFLVHIVAIALIFFHQRFLDGRPVSAAATPVNVEKPAAAPARDLPRLAAGEKPYIVQTGDNYARIAATAGVDETDLRSLNNHVDIRPGLILKIPPQRIVAEEPPEVAAIRRQTPSDRGRGMVENIDVSSAPKAVLVRPKVARQAPAAVGGKTYQVKPGDSIYAIANRHKIDQRSLMRANGIDDPRKLRSGMQLVIPAN